MIEEMKMSDKPMFANPKKSGRCSIIDGCGDNICKASGEYERDAIFKCITTHDQQAERIKELEDSLRVISGFYRCDLKEEGIDPMTCEHYRKSQELLEQSK